MIKKLLKNMTVAIAALFIAFVALPQAAQAQTKEAYVVKHSATLTFYYDTNKATRTGTVCGINDKRSDSANIPAWAGKGNSIITDITKVVFDNSFKDYKPTSTAYWFFNCAKINAIEGLSNLKTDKVTDMCLMFDSCSSLTLLDLSSFNTSNVTDMYSMFGSCSSLTSLDLSNFDTSKVTDMSYMFQECSQLTTIYCNDDWKSDVALESDMMFLRSTSLVGAVAYDASKTDVTMANPTTGYFTKTDNLKDYVVENGSTLTFYYDTNKAKRTGTVYDINAKHADNPNMPAWAGTYNNKKVNITKIVFDNSFLLYKPTSMKYWFYNCTKINAIEGLSNLKTDKVTSMGYTFVNCSSLTSLDLSNFNTENVVNMASMFYGCSSLTALDLSNFNTAKVTEMSYMFKDCSALKTLNVSSFNTANVTDMRGMLNGCKALTALDLSNFNTAKVRFMQSMFAGCSALTALDVSNFDTLNVIDMGSMFDYCNALKNLDLSNFNTANVTDMSYMFNSCFALSSLDLSNFDTANVTDMSSMFSGCRALTSANLTHFDTSNVTDMGRMFYYCEYLKTLDLASFNTAKVTDMSYMFQECSQLTTIYCNDDWNSSTVTNSTDMFDCCSRLVGAVAYDATKVDVTMANPTTGYFTKKDGGVESLESEAVPAARRGIYNLQGIKMQGSFDQLPAGFYIVNGQKVFKK